MAHLTDYWIVVVDGIPVSLHDSTKVALGMAKARKNDDPRDRVELHYAGAQATFDRDGPVIDAEIDVTTIICTVHG